MNQQDANKLMANERGALLHVGSGDPEWTTTTADEHYFPMEAEAVARLMNHAFQLGMDAKAAEIKGALGLGNP
jgi:hypothetical protein